MGRYQEVMVALSESVMKNRVKRPLAVTANDVISGITMMSYPVYNKTRHLGNHASQIKKLLLNTFMKSWSLSKLHEKSSTY